MLYRIMKQSTDEAGNIGYILDEEFEGSELEIKAKLAELNLEGYEHQAEFDTDSGVAVIKA
jgi:hypothetical protein